MLQGILLFGPPGTGKTTIGKAIATQNEVTFILLGNDDLIGTVHDEAEMRMKIVFEMVIHILSCFFQVNIILRIIFWQLLHDILVIWSLTTVNLAIILVFPEYYWIFTSTWIATKLVVVCGAVFHELDFKLNSIQFNMTSWNTHIGFLLCHGLNHFWTSNIVKWRCLWFCKSARLISDPLHRQTSNIPYSKGPGMCHTKADQ